MKNSKQIYIKIIDLLSKTALTRKELINAYISSLGLTREEMLDKSTHGKANIERSIAGAVINDMLDRSMITKDSDGKYLPSDQKPVIIRNEKCESEILKMLDGFTLTKNEIKRNLIRKFGTDKTLSEKDDNKLFAFMNDALRRMSRDGILKSDGRYYSLTQKVKATIDDINGMLLLEDSFLTRLHKKGGEFFETYFMTLLEKYITMYGKTVISNSTTGGSFDGGIDGIIQTVDCLGFKETIMVQTKNKIDPTNETTVRGFYGAVCARHGSRGIFVTSSDFHPGAKAFLDGIDNCVGIDGDKLFEMARITHYGIKKNGKELSIDEKII